MYIDGKYGARMGIVNNVLYINTFVNVNPLWDFPWETETGPDNQARLVDLRPAV